MLHKGSYFCKNRLNRKNTNIIHQGTWWQTSVKVWSKSFEKVEGVAHTVCPLADKPQSNNCKNKNECHSSSMVTLTFDPVTLFTESGQLLAAHMTDVWNDLWLRGKNNMLSRPINLGVMKIMTNKAEKCQEWKNNQ